LSTFNIDSHLYFDLACDELDIAEIVLGLEEEFSIEFIPDENERLNRLRTFLHLNAPISVIGDECQLVLRSLHGNSKWKLIYFLLDKALSDSLENYIVMPILTALHKLNLYHPRDSDGLCGWCWSDEIEEDQQ
jgi:hypothetical protein